jgi:hypothetical protein
MKRVKFNLNFMLSTVFSGPKRTKLRSSHKFYCRSDMPRSVKIHLVFSHVIMNISQETPWNRPENISRATSETVDMTSNICHWAAYFAQTMLPMKSRNSSVGLALGYGLDDRGSRVRFPAGAGNFSLHHRVQPGFGAHPASYPMGTRDSFPGSKAAGAWSWPLTFI